MRTGLAVGAVKSWSTGRFFGKLFTNFNLGSSSSAACNSACRVAIEVRVVPLERSERVDDESSMSSSAFSS